jgi:Ca-activated chloride channel family protein
MDFTNPHFEEPGWLWLAVLAPLLLAGLHRYASVARRKQLARVASPHLIGGLTRSHSPARRNLKHTLLLVSVALFGVALARPQWGELETQNQWLGDDVLFVLDCSRSMLATDVLPNRLQRAKYSILDFVRRHGTGRVGLVAFAGTAFLQCPLTFDYDAFEEALANLDERSLPVGGTDLGRSLLEAFHAMEKKSARKLIVILTDGEDLEKGGVKEAGTLGKDGVTVYAVGVGTAAGAELRATAANGQSDFVRDDNGQVVRSRLDEETLTQIAKATGGEYFPLGRVGEGLQKVRHAIETTNTAAFSRVRAQGVERFHVPIAMALMLLVIESLIGTRRGEPAKNVMKSTGQHTSAATVTALGLLICTAAVGGSTQTTNVATLLPPPPAPVTAREFYNAGVKRLAAGKLSEAEKMFEGALNQQDAQVQPLALYDLGHARFSIGSEQLKKSAAAGPARTRGEHADLAGADAIQSAEAALASKDIQQMVAAYQRGRGVRKELRGAYDAVYAALEVHRGTLEKWRRALGDFRSAAELNPTDTNALHNAEVVERALAKLVDSVVQTQTITLKCAGRCSKLNDLMCELKGRIPKDKMPPSAGNSDDEDDMGEPKLEELIGKQESGPKDGRESDLTLSREDAGGLLDSFKLGGNRRLPMGQGDPGQPKDRKRRDW